MVRPAEGFVADDGKFFENEKLCESYEATKNVTKVVIEQLHALNIRLPPYQELWLSKLALSFVVSHLDLFNRYAKTHPEPDPAEIKVTHDEVDDISDQLRGAISEGIEPSEFANKLPIDFRDLTPARSVDPDPTTTPPTPNPDDGTDRSNAETSKGIPN